MGSALKNTGVQQMLDGAVDFLPTPHERVNTAINPNEGDSKVTLDSKDLTKPVVALAFKTERTDFGQLTCVCLSIRAGAL